MKREDVEEAIEAVDDRLTSYLDETIRRVGLLEARLGALVKRHDTLTARGAETLNSVKSNQMSQAGTLDRHSARLAALEADRRYGRVEPDPVFAGLVHTGGTPTYPVGVSQSDVLKELKARLDRLEQNPADKAWAGRVESQLDQLGDLVEDRRLASIRLEERIAKLEKAAKPSGLYTAKLYRTGRDPGWDEGSYRPDKLLEQLYVAPHSALCGANYRATLDNYPGGYHWVVTNQAGTIVGVYVNRLSPDPQVFA